MDNEELYLQAVERAKNMVSRDATVRGDMARFNDTPTSRDLLEKCHFSYVKGINEGLKLFAGLMSQDFTALKPMYTRR